MFPLSDYEGILFVYEFPESAQEWMLPQVCKALEARDCAVRCFGGPFQRYRPGGLRLSRLLNLCWMVVFLPFVLIRHRGLGVVVRSTPPLLHLWAALWLKLFRMKGVLWLMDYHPEIEARWLERRFGLAWLAAVLRNLDKIVLRSYGWIISLDPVMCGSLKKQSGRDCVICFPTWPESWTAFAGEKEPKAEAWTSTESQIRLLYGGNLGPAHPTGTFRELLKGLSRECSIHISVVGCSRDGEERFREMERSISELVVEIIPRMGFANLASLARNYDFGIILMAEAWGGLLSPSKFAAYLAGDLPLIYIGPRETNAWRICAEFGAGIRLTDRAGMAEIEAAMRSIRGGRNDNFRKAVAQARLHFAQYDAERFAALLLESTA